MSLISKEHLSLTLQTIKKLLSRKADKSEVNELREEIVQSDWNQNDQSAKDYVKNRTHWTETTTEQKTESILLDCESSAGASEVVTVSQGFIKGLKENPDGVVVTMSIDDLKRTHRIEFSDPNNSNYFSIINLITERRDLHGYIGTNDAGESTVYVTDNNGMWTYCYIAVTYEDLVEKVHKLDSKYIPDSAFAQPDWNQNDESVIGYVKNRTHYSEPKTETRTFVADSSDGGRITDLAFAKILWTNRKTASYVANGKMITYSEDIPEVSGCFKVGTQFFVTVYLDTGLIVFGTPGGQGTFYEGSISVVGEEIHQLDEKFIPDTIARVSDIPSGGNTDQSGLSAELKTALVNYYTHVTPSFDDDNGLAYINAILTVLGAEIRDAI